MKDIKIKFVGFWNNLNPEGLFIYDFLSKHYNVEICDDPDYIICSCFAPYYEYCKYPQVRIMTVGENYIPDFNLVDYAICRYPISFLDRCFYEPGCFKPLDHSLALERKKTKKDKSFLASKEYFANLIASHESENGLRGYFLDELSKYKRVESPGSFRNNVDDLLGKVNWTDDSKTDFQRKCKFSLCLESTKHEGFVTEKITDAFYAETIPVYYGSDTVNDIFNRKAFINISSFDSFDAAIEYIKYIDNNDEKYIEMINEPVLNDMQYFSRLKNELESFILHIFEQPLEEAHRRSKVYSPKWHEDYILNLDESNVSRYSSLQLFGEVGRKAKHTVKRILQKT